MNLKPEEVFLAQGTLRPDLIESASLVASGKAEVIKTHHNDTELIRKLREEVNEKGYSCILLVLTDVKLSIKNEQLLCFAGTTVPCWWDPILMRPFRFCSNMLQFITLLSSCYILKVVKTAWVLSCTGYWGRCQQIERGFIQCVLIGVLNHKLKAVSSPFHSLILKTDLHPSKEAGQYQMPLAGE